MKSITYREKKNLVKEPITLRDFIHALSRVNIGLDTPFYLQLASGAQVDLALIARFEEFEVSSKDELPIIIIESPE